VDGGGDEGSDETSEEMLYSSEEKSMVHEPIFHLFYSFVN